MGANLTTDELVVTAIADDGLHRARLYVCGQARDAGDAHLLLDVLGLNGRHVRSKSRQVYRKRCGKCHRTRQIKSLGLCGNCWRGERP